MRDVMDALAELQAIEKAIETAGPLFQTREPLTDKIVSLIGQRSDLITQVLALRRELDAAHIRIYDLEAHLAEVERERDEARQREERSEGATWGATWEECEGMIHGILDFAEVPTPKVEDPETLTGERVFWLARDWARLRRALEGLMLSRDASWTGGHDWQEALEAAAAALAGEGEGASDASDA